MVDRSMLLDLIGRWWWNYDEGHFDVLTAALTQDVHFTARTDTGNAEWEEFVRADIRGRDAVMAWQIDHRVNSPYPLRHNGTNVHVVEDRGDSATFASYIFVTHLVGGVPTPLPAGIVNGTVRTDEGVLKISEMHVIIDTLESDTFSKMRG